MNSPENHFLLVSTLEQLSRFRTMQCAQSHEKIVEISKIEAGSYDLGHNDHPGWKLKIKGLCSKEIRNSTLGCSHSMVLVNYNDLLEKLSEQGIVDAGSVPLEEINELINDIYLMDHEKGHMEKCFSVLKNSGPEAKEEADEIALKLNDFRLQHAEMVKKLDALHQTVLQELGRIIAQSPQHA